MRGNCLYYRKEGKDERGGGGKILKSHHPALKGHLWCLCSCTCRLWTHMQPYCTHRGASPSTVCPIVCFLYIQCSHTVFFLSYTQSALVKCEPGVIALDSKKKNNFLFKWREQKWNEHQHWWSKLPLTSLYLSTLSVMYLWCLNA